MQITLTEDAKKYWTRLLDEKPSAKYVRLGVKGGGCAGFEYDWGTVETSDEVEDLDIVMDAGEGKFVIGSASMMFLFGTEIDYTKSIMGSNFEVRNPNAKSSCGCGVSINFDMDKLAESAI